MIDFQPMPKRFMVWQKDYQQFARKVLPGDIRDYVYTLPEMSFYYDDPDCIICQSTNLFDKNGKEIFESHILDNKYIVEFLNGKFVLKEISSGSIIDLYGYKGEITGSTLQI